MNFAAFLSASRNLLRHLSPRRTAQSRDHRAWPRLETLEERWVPSSSQITAFGAGPGGQPFVNVYRNGSSGGLEASFLAYDSRFLGGVHVAVADVNGDGIDDVITGAGAGGGPHVEVFDGRALSSGSAVVIGSFMAYNVAFSGGVYVAAADINRDGFADIITGAGPGGGPHVQVFDGRTLINVGTKNVLASFMAYNVSFTGGVTVAAADINADFFPDIITGAGPGMDPQVEVFNGIRIAQGVFDHVNDRLVAFDAFNPLFLGGVFVAGGDMNGDGFADVIVGAGAGGGPEVTVFDGHAIALGSFNSIIDQIMAFFPYNSSFPGGARVGYDPVTPGVLTAPGPGSLPLAGYGFSLVNFNPTFINIFGTFGGGMFVSV
jgi:hypothetical protein